MRLCLLFVGLCATASAAPSLFDRLGGKNAVTAVVDDLVQRVAADKRIKGRFLDVDAPRLKSGLVELLCAAAGGPCKYAGQDMHSAHAGMEIVDEEVDALLEDLTASMTKLSVQPPLQKEVLALLVPLKAQIVQPRDPSNPDKEMVEKAKQLASMLTNVGKVKPGELLELAVLARVRGQRNYAEELFSLAELQVKPTALAAIAPLFRDGAPPRVTQKPKPVSGSPQPVVMGSSDDDEPASKNMGAVSGSWKGVILLTPVGKKSARRPPKARTLEARDRRLAPRFLVVPLGSTVSFPNFDPLFHDLFAKTFDLGLYKSGEAREISFDKEGVAHVSCNLHANESALLVVTAAPYFIASDGDFSLKSVAPGKYKLVAIGQTSELTQNLDVKSGDNSVQLQQEEVKELGPDKFGQPR
jgi:hemoglobin